MCSKLLRLAVLISGGGTNLESLIKASKEKFFLSEIKLVVSNKKEAYGLERARNHGIESVYIKDDRLLLETLLDRNIDFVILAGYLKILGEDILSKYKNRIINIHPSLLPNYGGRGMYGIHVHKAVFLAGEHESGATVHYVTKDIDKGEIIIQKAVNISECKSPKEVQDKVLKIEYEIFKEAVLIVEEGCINEESVNQCYR
ncbi:MAG: phosphoribosylglycinamide formyltransferase [Filifactoraceae bacterium]